MPMEFPPREGLSFDDVMLLPSYSSVLPRDVCTKARLTKRLSLNVPLLSAAMNTVTESKMAIAMASSGGIGILHKFMQVGRQVEEIRRVKRHEARIVANPITISEDSSWIEAKDLMDTYGISALPVVRSPNLEVVGILTRRDIRFVEDDTMLVMALMTSDNLIMVHDEIEDEKAQHLMHEHKIEQIIILDDKNRCSGLITAKDLDRDKLHPNACRSSDGCLLVGASVGVGKEGYDRAAALIDAGVDLIVVDAGHGHAKDIIGTVSRIRQMQSDSLQVMAGNVATADGAQALIDVGADAIKVGLGSGKVATTSSGVGVGMPQLSAIYDVAGVCSVNDIPVISDGGVENAGDLAKAIAAGANCVMLGYLFAGANETPGDISMHNGQNCKLYRGMKSAGVMREKITDRYGRSTELNPGMITIEGDEIYVPCSGSVSKTITELMQGLRTSMGYTGSADIETMRRDCNFVKVTRR